MRQFGSRHLWVRVIAGGGLAVLIAACAATRTEATLTAAAAQRTTPPSPDQVSRKLRVRDVGPDPNVGTASEVNVRDKPSGVVPPAGKGTAGRPQCLVTVDNHTDLITKAYIDGRYSGTIRPYGELAMSTAPGSAVLYARAEYDDGSADAWGPVRVSCRTKYVWRLAD
jgi:hypothetical protein